MAEILDAILNGWVVEIYNESEDADLLELNGDDAMFSDDDVKDEHQEALTLIVDVSENISGTLKKF